MTNSTEVSRQRKIMHSIIQRVATGPHLSKDIDFEEARAGMKAILDGQISPVQAAIFLIALRMKRETQEENCGILQGIIDKAGSIAAEVDELLDISDPYDGWNRGLPVAAFLPAVMAACGIPSISHGLASVGPKYGATHRMVLQAVGKKVDLSPEAAAEQIARPDIGWAYLDQSVYCPALHEMTDFRAEMVKRTVITTVEVLIGPIRGKHATHMITGYVHKAYPSLYASLARQARFDSAMIVRGVEGGVIPSLQQKARLFYYHDGGEEQEMLLDPADIGITRDTRCVPLPESLSKTTKKGSGVVGKANVELIAQLAAEAGTEALQGKKGAAYDSLLYGAAIVWQHLKHDISLKQAADHVRNVLDNGSTWSFFEAAQ